jgi:polyribonucleotide nucleotidyltransferase
MMKFPALVILSLYFLSETPFYNKNGNGKGCSVAAFVPLQQRRTLSFHSSTSARRETAIATGDSDSPTTVADPSDTGDETTTTLLATLLEEVVAPPVLETEASFTIETIQRGPNVPGPVQRVTFHSIPGQEKGVAPLVLETGKIGRQAAGAIELTRGDTVLYATAARDPSPKDNIDFLPLSVEHQERFSSAGLTSGAYNKRDGRAAEHEILTCRLIDRPLRPLIQNGWRHETQLLSWVLSYDGVRSCDPLAITASAAALYISDVPLTKPVASVMVGFVNGQLIVNPTNAQMEISRLDLTVAGTKDGIMMIEGAADFLPEATMIQAVKLGHDAIIGLCEGIEALGKLAGKGKKLDTIKPPVDGLQERVDELFTDRVDAMYASGTKKKEAGTLMSELQVAVVVELAEEFPGEEIAIKAAFKDLLCLRMFVLGKEKGLRCDGRQLDQIRHLDMEAGFLPRVHGSALFTRGETQTIATATLGDSGMRQKIDKIDGTEVKRFYLQYTFPPSCVGETGRVGAPGRREVGHGNLAER